MFKLNHRRSGDTHPQGQTEHSIQLQKWGMVLMQIKLQIFLNKKYQICEYHKTSKNGECAL